jgi:hypothetical protein
MTFTHVFFAAYLYWLEKGYATGRYPCFVFFLTMMVWANLHGGFVAGFALLGLYALAEWRRPSALRSLGWIGAGTFLATLINPYGLALWPITLRSLFHPRPNFWEWAPVPWRGDWGAMLAYKILVLVILGIVVRRFWRKREWDRDFWAVAALVGAIVISSQHLRHASLFAILAGVYGVRLWEGTPVSTSIGPGRGWKWMAKRGLSLAALTVGLVVLLQGWRQSSFQAKPDPVTMPMAAVAQLKHSGRPGHLLVPFNYGSYALWELSPAMQVSADGRYDLVCDFAVHQAVCDFFEGKPGWEVFLKEHPPAAILAPVEALVIPPLLASGQWQEMFRDAQAVVLFPKEEGGKRN